MDVRPNSMSELAGLKTVLKRGALVTAANWPVVVIQFVAESTFKLLLGVPIVGGALLVALALGGDIGGLLSGSPRETVEAVATALVAHPGALAAFLVALAVVILGGSVFMFLVKGGTVTVLVDGTAGGGALERPPLRLAHLRQARRFSVACFTEGCRRLFRRYLSLGLVLLAAYALMGTAYLLVVVGGFRLAEEQGLMVAWTLLAALASSVLVVAVTVVNVGYLLTQMVIAADQCGVREAWWRVAAFVRRDLGDVALVAIAVLGLVLIATIASVLATAGLGLISFVPLVGLAVLPLQAAAWLVRGVVFQYLGLTALGAYLSLYRPVDAAPAGAARPAWARTAS